MQNEYTHVPGSRLMECYALRDDKMGTFLSPFWCDNIIQATRSLEQVLREGAGNLSQYPADFSLYLMCKMDDATGGIIYTPSKLPELIYNISSLIPKMPK